MQFILTQNGYLQFCLLAQRLVVPRKAEALTSRLFSMWAGRAPGKRKADLNPGHGRMETTSCVRGLPHAPSAITEEPPKRSDMGEQLTSGQRYLATSTQLGRHWHRISSKIHYIFTWEEDSELPLHSSLPAQPRPPPPAAPARPAPLGNSRSDWRCECTGTRLGLQQPSPTARFSNKSPGHGSCGVYKY